jgi:hypothetical protein
MDWLLLKTTGTTDQPAFASLLNEELTRSLQHLVEFRLGDLSN